jgi:hypothetical protein
MTEHSQRIVAGSLSTMEGARDQHDELPQRKG